MKVLNLDYYEKNVRFLGFLIVFAEFEKIEFFKLENIRS